MDLSKLQRKEGDPVELWSFEEGGDIEFMAEKPPFKDEESLTSKTDS